MYLKDMMRKPVALVLWILGMLLQTSPIPMHALYMGSAGLIQASLPAKLLPVNLPTLADFNRDGLPESLALAQGRLEIVSRNESVWQSPTGWTVIQAAITDLDRDGISEATLLVRRPFRLWPVDQWLPHGGRIANFQDSEGISCHLILIGWRGDKYGELWAGSALAEPLHSFTAADINGDKLQELVTLEGSYADTRSAPAHAIKVWEWNGFGFSVVSDIAGTFYEITLVRANIGPILILVP